MNRHRPKAAKGLVTAALLLAPAAALPQEATHRPRAREIGLTVGVLPTGRYNAITDVPGVTVGHRTRIEGSSIRTGVTAILPADGNLFQQKVPAALYVGNGHGKMAGSTQVEELGLIETPIVLTNTLAVSTGVSALIRYTLGLPGNEQVRSVNAVVGETNDGTLNDIRGMALRETDVVDAIRGAKGGPVAEGNVGAGTGTIAFLYKGGIGTSSRRVRTSIGTYTVGVLVQANYGELLELKGVPFHAPRAQAYLDAILPGDDGASVPPPGGSCMVVVATDAPLDSRNLKRIAKRAIMALGRPGSAMANNSGEYAIAFTTSYRVSADGTKGVQMPVMLPNDQVTPLFEATAEATEEAVYNALLKAETMEGRDGNLAEALPVEALRHKLIKHGAIAEENGNGRRR